MKQTIVNEYKSSRYLKDVLNFSIKFKSFDFERYSLIHSYNKIELDDPPKVHN